ncbi:hypothetical protein TYRP_001310 [Tyrophagus putrescentiae]|nr:hypothetical protein TYRP_001310 [Tyrophagus putrescentiae]
MSRNEATWNTFHFAFSKAQVLTCLHLHSAAVELSQSLRRRLCIAVHLTGVNVRGDLVDLVSWPQQAVRLNAGHCPHKVHALTVEELVEGVIRWNGYGVAAGVSLCRWILAALNGLLLFVWV